MKPSFFLTIRCFFVFLGNLLWSTPPPFKELMQWPIITYNFTTSLISVKCASPLKVWSDAHVTHFIGLPIFLLKDDIGDGQVIWQELMTCWPKPFTPNHAFCIEVSGTNWDSLWGTTLNDVISVSEKRKALAVCPLLWSFTCCKGLVIPPTIEAIQHLVNDRFQASMPMTKDGYAMATGVFRRSPIHFTSRGITRRNKWCCV